jgi:hypothetical protein
VPVRRWLDKVRPDVAIVFSNDHGLNFFLDKMPTFAIGAAPEYRNADEGWGLPLYRAFPGDQALSWHIIEHLVADEFDVTTSQQMLLDHAVSIPFELCWPGDRRTRCAWFREGRQRDAANRPPRDGGPGLNPVRPARPAAPGHPLRVTSRIQVSARIARGQPSVVMAR